MTKFEDTAIKVGQFTVCSSDYLISFKFYHRLLFCFFVDFFANIILQVGALLINT